MNFKVFDIEIQNSKNLGFTISGQVNSYMRVEQLDPAGLAYKSGLKENDYILTINGKTVENRDEIINTIYQSQNKLTIKVIRYDNGKIVNTQSTNYQSPKLVRRTTTDLQSLHRDLLSNLGAKIGMEISRSYGAEDKSRKLNNNKLIKRCNTDSKMLNRDFTSTLLKSRSLGLRRRVSDLDRQGTPVNSVARKFSHNSFRVMPSTFKSSNYITASSVPTRKELPEMMNSGHEFAKRNWSLRKENTPVGISSQCKSLSNIANIGKSNSNVSLRMEKKLSTTNMGSMISLFEEELTRSSIGEYRIDWKAIFTKVSPRIINETELELTRYFLNNRADLTCFQMSSLYRYITFDNVLGIVFNDILQMDSEGDFCHKLLKSGTKRTDDDMNMNLDDIVNLVEFNISVLEQWIRDYEERETNLLQNATKMKEALCQFVKKPDLTPKIHVQVDKICSKFQLLSKIIVSMVSYMSMWKLCNDLPKECKSEQNKLDDCEIVLGEFRISQRIFEQQIIKFFSQFSDESSDEVMKLVDHIFSEELEISICLPIFKLKLRIDLMTLSSLVDTPSGVREEQFV